ncbi:serine/threonine protein kinase [Labilithrix luteola]|uniref:non-specific serine/threonine protein kinase n=1 Tax=Labilithrix luteola TaxID=1391654 RepID=A0A0K1PUA2_9BACT|nr:serine/threonine-protein kinase [Labilithrix luteola]AKU96946.1 serine/threonine protein kinase [Labilithrix luteola]
MALERAKLSDFKIAGALGSGTTSRVYEGVHVATGRQVAIKMLEPSQSGREMRERFAREAVLLSSLSSRHVGKLLGFGFEHGQPFLVLERLTGETLDAKLRRDGPVPLPLAMRWMEQLILGVRDCHAAQVIHRDIKPSNVYLHREGFEDVVKLIDFGVARLRDITGEGGGLTSTNHLIGSMGYMAPEQFADAKGVGFAADVYALGVVIFRTLTGRLPFVSRSIEAVIRMKTEQSAPAISSIPGMPVNELLDRFVLKAMARSPGDRFQTTREMLEQWWIVMASVDDVEATDVMRGIGRVDESYAGPLVRPARDDEALSQGPYTDPVPTPRLQNESGLRSFPGPPPVRLPEPSTAGISDGSIPVVVSSGSEPPELATTLDEPAPRTMPMGGGSQRPAERPTDPGVLHDPFDVPTRSDPSLRKLVERELELHRKRTGQG